MESNPATQLFRVSFIAPLILTTVIAVLFFRILQAFLLPLFVALVLVIVFQPVFGWILIRCKNRRTLAAALTTGLVLAGVLLPFFLLVSLAVAQGVSFFGQGDWSGIANRLIRLRQTFGLQMPYESVLRRVDRTFLELRSRVDRGEILTEQMAAPLVQQLALLADRLAEPERATLGRKLEEAQRALTLAAGEMPWLGEEALQRAWLHYQEFRSALFGDPVRRWLVELLNPDAAQREQWRDSIRQFVQAYLVPLGGATVVFLLKLLLGLVINVIAVFFFFHDGPTMLTGIGKLIPLDEAHQRELIAEFAAASRSIVLAIVVSAFVQGFLAGIGFWLAGFDAVFLLSGLTVLCAVIPFVGAATVWLPAVAWLYFIEERTVAAVLLLAYGAVVVSQIDNLVKPWILHGQSHLHPLLGLISVLGGVQALGAIGVLLGPITVVCLQTALKIVHRELTGAKTDATPQLAASASSEAAS